MNNIYCTWMVWQAFTKLFGSTLSPNRRSKYILQMRKLRHQEVNELQLFQLSPPLSGLCSPSKLDSWLSGAAGGAVASERKAAFWPAISDL